MKVSLCTSDQWPLSEPAQVVNDLLADIAHAYASEHQADGLKPMGRKERKRQAA